MNKIKKTDDIFHLSFLSHRKLLKSDLAVLHCSGTSKTAIGEQLPAGVDRFFKKEDCIMPKIFENKKDMFAEHVLSLDEFRLFSDVKNLSFTDDIKTNLLDIAEEYATMEYEPILAHSYMRYEKNGNRSIYEGEYFKRRRMVWHLFLGEYIERKGRFLEKLIDGIWLILDECSWVIPAHTKIRIDYVPKLPLQYKNEVDVVDLFAAETGAMLSLVGYLGQSFLDEVTPIIRDRIIYEVRRRVLMPYLNYNDYWWMGYVRRNINNWCPWITSNVLLSCALLESDMETRKSITRKSMEVIDHFTRIYHEAGGCDEGPNYWTVAGASYFDCLEILYDITGGYADVFDDPFIRSMGEYIAKFCINIDKNYYINFADSGPRVNVNKNLVARFGRRTHSDILIRFGLNCHKSAPDAQMQHTLYRSLKNLYEENLSESMPNKYPKKVWFGGIQVMTARESENNSDGLFFAMKGGHNKESHNHNDVGQFVVYDNGEPLIIDVGVGTYCADTFNENRYKIWTMRSCYHNLPSFGDVEQKCGFEYHSENVLYDEEHNKLSMELKRTYPEESSLVRFVRTGELSDGAIRITDDIELLDQKKVTFHFMTAAQPILIESGVIQLSAQRNLYFNSNELKVSIEKIQIEDSTIQKNWGREELYRISLSAEKTQKNNFEFVIK